MYKKEYMEKMRERRVNLYKIGVLCIEVKCI